MVVFIILSAPRLLRWLAIVQQKEYRLDRILMFLKTGEGVNELLKLVPRLQDLTRSSLKRPVRTSRLYVTLLITFIIIYVTILTALTINILGTIGFIVGFVLLYLLWPLIILLAVVPTALVSNVVTMVVLQLAQLKISWSKPIIIGITGSYGKSTTKYLIKEILSKQQPVFATPLSYNTRFSIALSILKNYHGEKIAILEFGAYKIGEIKTLCKYFPPTVAVITGFSSQHLGLFGSEENIIRAKSELVQALPANASVFCNDSDAGAMAIAKSRSDVKVVEATSVVHFLNTDLNNNGQLSFTWNNSHSQTKLVGRHYETNLKLAIAVSEYFKVPKEKIAEALTEFAPNPLVIKVNQNSKGALIIDDGKTSNPKGFLAALDLAHELKEKNSAQHATLVTAGIVDLGNQSDRIHSDLAKAAHNIFDQVYYFGSCGNNEFKSEFRENFNIDITKIKKFLNEKALGDLVLIEGRVPKWIYETLGI